MIKKIAHENRDVVVMIDGTKYVVHEDVYYACVEMGKRLKRYKTEKTIDLIVIFIQMGIICYLTGVK